MTLAVLPSAFLFKSCSLLCSTTWIFCACLPPFFPPLLFFLPCPAGGFLPAWWHSHCSSSTYWPRHGSTRRVSHPSLLDTHHCFVQRRHLSLKRSWKSSPPKQLHVVHKNLVTYCIRKFPGMTFNERNTPQQRVHKDDSHFIGVRHMWKTMVVVPKCTVHNSLRKPPRTRRKKPPQYPNQQCPKCSSTGFQTENVQKCTRSLTLAPFPDQTRISQEFIPRRQAWTAELSVGRGSQWIVRAARKKLEEPKANRGAVQTKPLNFLFLVFKKTRCADSSCKSSLLNHLHEGIDSLSLSLSDTGYKRVPSEDSAQRWAGRSGTSHVQQCLSNVFGELRSFPGQNKRVLKTQKGASAPQKPTNCESVQKVVLPTMSGH